MKKNSNKGFTVRTRYRGLGLIQLQPMGDPFFIPEMENPVIVPITTQTSGPLVQNDPVVTYTNPQQVVTTPTPVQVAPRPLTPDPILDAEVLVSVPVTTVTATPVVETVLQTPTPVVPTEQAISVSSIVPATTTPVTTTYYSSSGSGGGSGSSWGSSNASSTPAVTVTTTETQTQKETTVQNNNLKYVGYSILGLLGLWGISKLLKKEKTGLNEPVNVEL